MTEGGNAFGAKRAYLNPQADFARYDSVIVDPITIIAPRSSKLTSKDRLLLANAMHQAVIRELSKDYRITREAGPSTFRLRGALTNLKAANRP